MERPEGRIQKVLTCQTQENDRLIVNSSSLLVSALIS